MSVYLKSTTYGCYQTKVEIPKEFKDKKSKEYKEWKNKKDKEFDKKVVKNNNDKWWKNLSIEEKKTYPDSKTAKDRRTRLSGNIFPCKNYKTITF